MLWTLPICPWQVLPVQLMPLMSSAWAPPARRRHTRQGWQPQAKVATRAHGAMTRACCASVSPMISPAPVRPGWKHPPGAFAGSAGRRGLWLQAGRASRSLWVAGAMQRAVLGLLPQGTAHLGMRQWALILPGQHPRSASRLLNTLTFSLTGI